MKNTVILQTCESGTLRWRGFYNPVQVIEAHEPDQVMPALRAVENAIDTGLYAAGFLSYEAAGGIDHALRTHRGTALPLVWFGLYRGLEAVNPPEAGGKDAFAVGQWRPSIDVDEYHAGFDRIKGYIAAGDTYQVNYTLRLRASFEGDPWSLFCRLCRAQPSQYAAFVDAGRFAICSSSPELFFHLDGRQVACLPMKGTADRGLTLADDNARKHALSISEKNRAENAMIVDMVRNDLGRVALPGSVAVSALFHVERLPTVFQMTSTVTARTTASFSRIMEALFPCASITGAPKVRTMEIIREVEPDPRGVYTGCIGYVLPGRQARFSVAIRTVVVDQAAKTAEYGCGGGIVWDSEAADEYAESMSKTQVLVADRPEFELLESLLWDGPNGYFLLDRHLDRLRDSGEYFDFVVNVPEVRSRLAEWGTRMAASPHKVRLRVSRAGGITVEAVPIVPRPAGVPWRLSWAASPVNSRDPFLYHKTTHRRAYDNASPQVAGGDDVILWNERGEVTETRIGNLVIEQDGKLYTPPVSSGLLAGVFRGHLLARDEIREKTIRTDELTPARRVYVINSVRKWLTSEILLPGRT